MPGMRWKGRDLPGTLKLGSWGVRGALSGAPWSFADLGETCLPFEFALGRR